MYHTKAFKGVYNGKPYDSELEATWYSFLDKLGISYKVPQSSQGFRGLIPDLLIDSNTIAEIKPIDYRKPEDATYWIMNLVEKFNKYREIPEQANKIQLILGCGQYIYDWAFLEYAPIGYIRFPYSDVFDSAFISPGQFVTSKGRNLIKAEKLEKLWQQSVDDAKSDRRLKEAFGYLLEDE
jgi:hypothetical protein